MQRDLGYDMQDFSEKPLQHGISHQPPKWTEDVPACIAVGAILFFFGLFALASVEAGLTEKRWLRTTALVVGANLAMAGWLLLSGAFLVALLAVVWAAQD
jgi:hypothetical protein